MSNRNQYRVLVTGTAGTVGKAVGAMLRERGHFVRGLDLHRSGAAVDEAMEGSIDDPETVGRAVAGMDTIVHLAAQPDEAPFMERLLKPNVIGVYRILEAAREAAVRRVILTSSIQVVDGFRETPECPVIRIADGTAPKNHYAVTKVLAEEWGGMYHRRFGLSVVAARLGWVPRSKTVVDCASKRDRLRGLYLSHGDAGRFFCRAVEAESIGFAVVFVTGPAGGRPRFDPADARDLFGYEPRDDFPEGLSFE